MLGSELICNFKFRLASDTRIIFQRNHIQIEYTEEPQEIAIWVCVRVCLSMLQISIRKPNELGVRSNNELINTNQKEEEKNIQNSHTTRKKMIPHRIQRNLNFDKTRNLFTSYQWHDKRKKKQFYFSVLVCFFLRLLLFAYLVLHLFK